MGGLQALEALLGYGLGHGLITPLDVPWVRNNLLTLLKYGPADVDAALFVEATPAEFPETATDILTALTDDYAARGHLETDTTTTRDLLETAIMGLFTPAPSVVAAQFAADYARAPEAATDAFFCQSKATNYILVDRIKKDLYWPAPTENYGTLEMTVNLSKPEKDPKDIAAARSQPAASYPKCLLCRENTGFPGHANWPARQNLRAVPITLVGEPWYLQYSPYAYYNEHCIIFSHDHAPMTISQQTFARLVDFVRQFPHYFIGSNADLPIVGGSILTHEHFQGGRHTFAMEKAAAYRTYTHPRHPQATLSLVQWPMTVLRLAVPWQDAALLPGLAAEVLDAWRNYSEGDVLSHTGDTPHNTVTPIVRRNALGQMEMDLVLRNNRTSDAFPMGIFHPHPEWHHVKKENIGLIEVMGLAVLPGRLKEEIAAGRLSQEEIGRVFAHVLWDCGVFKDDEAGRGRFAAFVATLIS